MSDRPNPESETVLPGVEVPDDADEALDEAPDSETLRASEDDEGLGDLLRRATLPEEDSGASLLPGVQRRLRERSRGKFYRDGWSTEPSAARYATIALVMLVLLAVAYFALGPTGFSTP